MSPTVVLICARAMRSGFMASFSRERAPRGPSAPVASKPVNGLFVDRGGRTAFLVSGALLASASTIPWIFVREGGAHLYTIRLFPGAAYSFFATASYAYIP